jgi:uncharacterized protein (TIRG00374 family)
MRRWYVWLPISVGLLALLGWRTRPWDAAALASRLDAWPLLVAVALNALVVLLWAVRSRSLMAAVGSPMGTLQLVPVTSFANTVNNLTPASSGEVLRAMILRRKFGVPYAPSTAVILLERVWAIGLMLVSAGAAAFGTLIAAPPWLVALAWTAALVAAFAPSLLYALDLRPGRVLKRWAAPPVEGEHRSRAGRLAHHAVDVDDRLELILTRPRWSAHFVATTAIIFATFAIQLWLVLYALEQPIPIAGVWAAYGLAICAGVVSALPFGLGATDVVLVVLLGAQGVDPATAGAAALILRLVTTLPLGILGTASWIWLNRGPDHVQADIAADPGPAADTPT